MLKHSYESRQFREEAKCDSRLHPGTGNAWVERALINIWDGALTLPVDTLPPVSHGGGNQTKKSKSRQQWRYRTSVPRRQRQQNYPSSLAAPPPALNVSAWREVKSQACYVLPQRPRAIARERSWRRGRSHVGVKVYRVSQHSVG